jgi:hypothetical protein
MNVIISMRPFEFISQSKNYDSNVGYSSTINIIKKIILIVKIENGNTIIFFKSS